ncbi:MAG: CCDC90 family protein [Gammaproteobacteria bacterium]|nr:CCDC90 family protein [Gammaproteobacteria bacterium]
MDYLYSLYDALVSIHVPNDKARAVIDAMERDMGTTIATKADLQLLRQEMATKVDLAGLRQDFASLRQEFALLRKDFEVLSAGLRKDLDVQSTGFHKDLELLSTTMTVRLGYMLVVGFGVMIAALKFLQS